MNDRRINDLVRMALEVEELEHAANTPGLRLAGEGAVPRGHSRSGARRAWFVGIGLAAAAGLALVFALPAITHQDQPKDGPIAAKPDTTPAPTPDPVIVRHQPLNTAIATNPLGTGVSKSIRRIGMRPAESSQCDGSSLSESASTGGGER